MRLGKFHKHIDNGGISIEVNCEVGPKGISIRTDTQYFGYPNVVSELNGGHHLTSSDLRSIGMMLIESAAKLEGHGSDQFPPRNPTAPLPEPIQVWTL